MKKAAFLFFLLLLSVYGKAQQQGNDVFLTAGSNGTLCAMAPNADQSTNYLSIYNEGDGNGHYTAGPYDRYIIVDSGDCEGERSMSFYFTSFDIHPSDTLFIYDGQSLNAPLLIACNNNMNPQINTTIFPSQLNTSGRLTLRFKTNGDTLVGAGFVISVQCRDKCETVTPVIDTFFYKTKNGVIVDTGYTRWVTVYDTMWNVDSTEYTLDTQFFRGVHLCLGEGVIFNGHGVYTNYYGYHPSDSWSLFEWNFGNGDDSAGMNLINVPARYRDLDCYDVTLSITDSRGCKSTMMETVKVRVAQNPIKTIFDLNPMCVTDSVLVNIGYEGSNSTITMTRITFNKTKSRSIDCKTFLPDAGPNHPCPAGDNENCFRAPIPFDDFPAGRVVQSGEDVCSVCINWEHSWLGDVRGYLVCPTGQMATLWHGQDGHDPTIPKDPVSGAILLEEGQYNGQSRYIGVPYGGQNDGNGDVYGCGGFDNKCDSVCNMYGIGYDYCFSRNGNYTTWTGHACNTDNPIANDYFCKYGGTGCYGGRGDDTIVPEQQFEQIPPPFYNAGYTAPASTTTTKKWSDHENQTGYYIPVSDFHELEGCPLNGEWSIRVCDTWGGDNGWIFEWALDFCGISSGQGCEYQVGIDSVVWKPDTNYGDFDQGYWRGLHIDMTNPTKSVIKSPDTAGHFPINVKIYDEFGCVWDTNTSIRTVWSPIPDVGDTLLICDVEQVVLDAKDRHTHQSVQSYKWEPFGQITDTIHTASMMGASTLYTVEVENNMEGITCRARDSVRVNINRQPLPNFDPGVYPLEGCEPYTIHFENTSQYGDKFLWVFGDGDSSTAKSPTHTFGTGQYNFKYYVESNNGCKDSLVYTDLITVYSSPVARFSWEPMNPTVMHPSVTFQNLTIPQSDDNHYYWEIQYDRDNHISYHTLTDVNPTFEWTTDGEDISGNYIARLIAMTENMGPSGTIVECRDTIENSILLVNDFLQFPNVVTPNGDGINDKFIVRNLVDGLGYPNNSLAIYDRWGKRVFYKENISSDDDFWDPAEDNIPAGTYFWRFTGKGYLGDIQRNGVIEVIK